MGSGGAPLRLASGDAEGRVVVWDIASGTPVLALEDPLHAAAGPKSERGRGGAVRGLAWVLASPARLAIVTASGAFLVWDVAGARTPLSCFLSMPAGGICCYCWCVHASSCYFACLSGHLPPLPERARLSLLVLYACQGHLCRFPGQPSAHALAVALRILCRFCRDVTCLVVFIMKIKENQGGVGHPVVTWRS
jgi:WD40 repeat protein